MSLSAHVEMAPGPFWRVVYHTLHHAIILLLRCVCTCSAGLIGVTGATLTRLGRTPAPEGASSAELLGDHGLSDNAVQMNNGVMPRTRCTIDGLVASSFWIAIKADGSRACLPSRALLERACAIRASVLSAVELVRRSIFGSVDPG